MSEATMTDIETVRWALDKYVKNPRMGEPSARAALSRIERVVEAAKKALESADITGDCMPEDTLREALGALDG